MNAHSDSAGAVPPQRALIPASEPARALTARRWPRLPALPVRLALPAISRTAGAVAAGLALEYALRGAANHALSRVTSPRQPASPRSHARAVITRTIVTEVIVVERFRRRA